MKTIRLISMQPKQVSSKPIRLNKMNKENSANKTTRLLIYSIVIMSTITQFQNSLRVQAKKDKAISASDDSSSEESTPSSAISSDELSTESLLELIEGNFLSKPDKNVKKVNTQQQQTGQAARVVASNSAPGDWWNKLGSTNSYKGMDKTISNNKNKPNRVKVYRPPVYVEQPSNQNAIMTARENLNAIKRQHRLLVTRGVDELVRLDSKLVEGFKICMSNDMPLYGSMLYRTRDYVTKLGRDIKQQRLVLESWAKKAQITLKDTMKNKTMVKNYNKMLAKQQRERENDKQQSTILYKLYDDISKTTTTTTPKIMSDHKGFSKQAHEPLEYSTFSESLSYPMAYSRKGFNFKRNSKYNPTKSSSLKMLLLQEQQKRLNTEPQIEWIYQAPKLRYPVTIYEINLRRDLQKSQELLDKIDQVSRDLTDIVDDITIVARIDEFIPQSKKQRFSSGQLNQLADYRKAFEKYQINQPTINAKSRSPVQNNHRLSHLAYQMTANSEIQDDNSVTTNNPSSPQPTISATASAATTKTMTTNGISFINKATAINERQSIHNNIDLDTNETFNDVQDSTIRFMTTKISSN